VSSCPRWPGGGEGNTNTNQQQQLTRFWCARWCTRTCIHPHSHEARRFFSAMLGAAGVPYVCHMLFCLVLIKKTYFWFSMEHARADARAAPPASGPGNKDTSVPDSPKRQREPALANMVSPGATLRATAIAEIQRSSPERKRPTRASTSQSLAHHATLTGRCRKPADHEA
jgi:hypothetical protein